ncbi:hypothetical protein PLICRDRAFT_129440 [Plicaturopsis crispa FD-325 SS-3]|nr:hypothetical protein PLICRDRAFT_129440 [Plicaturopsis crispa FD-325 SS-3]
MIIADDAPDSPLKGQHVDLASNSGSGSSAAPAPPPPYDYGTSRPAAYQPYPGQSLIPPVAEPPRESPAKRFIKAFAVAAVIWFLFAVFTQSVVDVARTVRRPHHHSDERWSYPSKGEPIPAHGNIGGCLGPQALSKGQLAVKTAEEHPALYTKASFDLPTSADLLHLFARGSRVSGVASIAIANSQDAHADSIRVDVVARYFYPAAMEDVQVCLLRKDAHGKKSYGVGISTPENAGPSIGDKIIFFEVTVSLPAKHHNPLRIPSFETDLPGFAHEIGDLQGIVEFDSLSLSGSNGRVHVGSVSGSDISIKTSNAGISGLFNTSSSITLVTSNKQIDISANLRSTEAKSSPISLLLKTTNGPIDAAVRLIADGSSISPYAVNVATTNAALTVNYLEQPLDSVLAFDGRTSNGPASALLPPAYEGSFALTSSGKYPRVEEERVRDPAGLGRGRSVEQRMLARTLSGNIWWGDRRKTQGLVTLKTTNSPASLKV